MPFDALTFCEYTPKSWTEVREIAFTLSGWVFRGQSDWSWRLETSLERAAHYSGCSSKLIPSKEKFILRQFQRRAHQFISDAPAEDKKFEWLALLQHHGGPTRLLDFTHSFYVACYFALERASSDAAVFCLNKPMLQENVKDLLKGPDQGVIDFSDRNLSEVCNALLNEEYRNPRVLVAEPFMMNERLSIQQGTFAVPFEVQQRFEYNLALTIDPYEKHLPGTTDITSETDLQDRLVERTILLKLKLPRAMHVDMKRDLQSMNINAASLFPGLDGFARSLYSAFDFFSDFSTSHD